MKRLAFIAAMLMTACSGAPVIGEQKVGLDNTLLIMPDSSVWLVNHRTGNVRLLSCK